ncbi:MAG: ABC transporter ATP-binding protein [Chloroflexota bacterium]
MLSSDPAILVEALNKDYGAKRAIDDLSFSVPAGEIFALLGPNGAGKTSTIEILEGYRRAGSGEVRVLGFDPATEGRRLKPHIGVMLQEGGLYPAMTAREALDLYRHFYSNAASTSDLLALVGLNSSSSTPYRRLSGGQKQRLALALALVGRPQLVFLDEPTAGLDPQARIMTWDTIRALREGGVTVMLTTHYLEEAERLADRVAIINSGRLVALGSPSSLIQGDATVLRLRTNQAVAMDELRSLPAAGSVRQDADGTYVIETPDARALLAQTTAWLAQIGVLATDLRVGQGSLEDLFLALTVEKV